MTLLDCPEQSQTSPIKMLLSSLICLPCEIEIFFLLKFPGIAFGTGISMLHFPSKVDLVLKVFELQSVLTITAAPAAAFPQICNGLPC